MKCFFNGLIVLLSVYAAYTAAELTKFMKTHDEVSGVYKNEDGSLGIKFVCREGYLHIDTLNNVTLIHFDNSLHEVDKRMAHSVNILNGEYLRHKHSAHRHLDGSVGNTKPFNETINDLLQMEEVILLEDVSHAIGTQGVTGKNTPIILPFYMFALKVTQLLDVSQTNALNKKSPTPSRMKRWTGCLKYKNYSNCKGLCGRKCSCWRWVCGDCCYHQACFDHDMCCNKYGYFSSQCFLTWSEIRTLRSACDRPFRC